MTARVLIALVVAITGCSKKSRPVHEDAGAGSSVRTPASPSRSGGSGAKDRARSTIDRAAVDRAVAAENDRRCVAGNLEACRTLGIFYQSGIGVAADRSRAAALFAQACNGGNLSACNHLALALAEGMGIARDVPKAAEVFQKACDGGNPLACSNLGVMLRDGHGVPAELARADALLDKACTMGVPSACTHAGNLDATLVEKEGAPRKKKMLGHFTRGCEAGDAVACRQIGVLYLDGFALPRSASAAAVWLKKACDGDDAIACRVLGLLHRDGAGVARDPDRSATLLRRACDRKDDAACKLIGAAGAKPAPPGGDAGVPDAGASAPGSRGSDSRLPE